MHALALWALFGWPGPPGAAPGTGVADSPPPQIEAPHGQGLGRAAVRIRSATPQQWQWLRAHSLDSWSEHGQGPDLVFSHADLERLRARDISFDLLVPDLERLAALERERLERNFDSPPPSVFSPLYFTEFRPLKALASAWAELAATYPDTVSLQTIGSSVQSRPLHALRIGNPDAPRSVVFAFGQHAREWISPATGTCFAMRLAQSDDPATLALLDEVQVWLVPVVNPDGYAYSWEEDRFWRKNRRDEIGVDLNRNWDAAFGVEPGSSSDPDSNNYRGPAPFSEPETAAVRDLASGLPELRAYVDVHSYSQLVLYPLSYLSEEVPEMQGLTRAWAEQTAATMSALYGTEYVPLRGSELYPAAGVAMDWAFEALEVPSFTFELRPGGDVSFPTGFVLPPEEILDTCDEVEAALLDMSYWARDGGPEPVEPPPPNPPEPPESGESGESADADADTDADADAESEVGSSTESDSSTESEVGSGEGTRPNADAGGTSAGGCACASGQGEGPELPLHLASFALLLGLGGFRRRARARS